ncbi:hypothetical protein BH23GEM11_BH23GEM11_01820 [soil metagenome]
MIRSVEARIAELARVQHGVASRRQLLAEGLTPRQVQRRLEDERLRTIHRGVYLVGPHTSPRAREMAAVLACGEGAVLSHRSAAVLWDLLQPLDQAGEGPGGHGPEWCEPVHVSLRQGDRGRGRPGLQVHRMRRLTAADRAMVEGIPVTGPVRTLLDLAWSESSRRPGGRVSRREVEQAVAQADRKGLVGPGDLASMAALRSHGPGRARGRGRGHPGEPLLRQLLQAERGPALARSEAEERFLGLIRQAKLPLPATNARLGSYEVDFLWPELGVGVEVDGYGFHSSRRRFEADRIRDSELAARGVHVTRVTWRQILEEPVAVLGRVARIMGRAGS